MHRLLKVPYDFDIDLESIEPLSSFDLELYLDYEELFPKLNRESTYIIGDSSLFHQISEPCEPKDCDCIKYPVLLNDGDDLIEGYHFLDEGFGFNCAGFALCRLAGINVEKHIKLDKLKFSVIETLNEFSACAVDSCKDELVPDNLSEVPFDSANPSFGDGALLFFYRAHNKCTHIAKCFSKIQATQTNGNLVELENYCISKIGSSYSLLHPFDALEEGAYGRIYSKMLVLKEKKDTDDTGTNTDLIWIIAGTTTALITIITTIYCCRNNIARYYTHLRQE